MAALTCCGISYYCSRVSAANYPHNGLCCASNCLSCTVCLMFVDKQYILKSLNKRLTSGGYTLARGCICPHTDCSLFCICLAMVVNVHLHLFASACTMRSWVHVYSRIASTNAECTHNWKRASTTMRYLSILHLAMLSVLTTGSRLPPLVERHLAKTHR